jgi:hypothetical protein
MMNCSWTTIFRLDWIGTRGAEICMAILKVNGTVLALHKDTAHLNRLAKLFVHKR